MAYLGDIDLGDTIDLLFTTVNTSGVPTQLAGTPAVSAYVDNSTTQITAGITLTVDFDGVTGLNHVRVVATSGNGYTTGTNVTLVITTGTVSGSSVVGYVVGTFSLDKRSALRPTTAGRTLDVSAGGEAGLDWANIGSPTTAQNLSGTSTKALEPTTAGRTLDVTATGAAGVDWGNVENQSTAVNLSATNIDVDQVVASVTGAVGSVTGAVGSVTGNVGGNVTGSVGSVATGGITAASIADGAIDRATFAADTGLQSIRSNTAQAGGASTITLDASASATNDFYNNMLCYLTGGTGAGQAALITDYVGATKVATIKPAWITQPSTDTTFALLPAGSVWDQVMADHVVSGSTGAALNAAGSAGDPWSTSLPGAYGAGTAGFILGTNLDALVSSRSTLTQTQVTGGAYSVQSSSCVLGDARIANLDATVSSRLAPTTSGRTLDVTATGAAGIDWGNVENQSTAVNLSATNIDVDQVVASVSGAVGSVTGSVTVGTNNDKTGYALSAAGVDAIWDEPLAAHTTADTPGNVLNMLTQDTVTLSSDVALGSIVGQLLDAGTSWTYDRTTDSLEAQRDNLGTNGAAVVLGSGALANVTAWTVAITGNITGNLSGSVGSVSGAVGSVTGNVGGNVSGTVASVVGNVGGNVVGSVASVTAPVTLTSAYDFAKGTVAMTESYAANGTAPTPVQALMAIHQSLGSYIVSGTSWTIRKLDGSTTAFVITMNSATDVTAINRA